jgi:hypothetical protein
MLLSFAVFENIYIYRRIPTLLLLFQHIGEMTGTNHIIQPLVRWCLANFLPRLTLNCDPPDLCIPSPYDYRIEPLDLSYLI